MFLDGGVEVAGVDVLLEDEAVSIDEDAGG